jgi:transcriptional regulator with XRE-family HTH domain
MLNADFVGFPFPKTAKALPAIKDMKLEELVELILNKHSTHATRELVELEIQTDITPLSRLRFESKKSQRLGCEEGREVLSCAEMEKYTFEQLIYLLSQANSFSTQEERAKIGAIMREVRRKIINGKKISVNVFAEKLGVSNQYVSLIEIGKSSFGALFIQRFISVAMSLKEEADQYLKSIEE